LSSTRVLTTQLLAVFVVACAALSSMMKFGGAGASRGQLLGIGALLLLGAALLARSLALQMTPGSRQRIPAWGAVAILGTGLLVGMLVLFPWKTPEAFLFLGWRCLRLGLTVSVPGAAIFWFLVRRGAPFDLTTMGGTLGAITGLLSMAVLQFRCSLHDVGHLVVWHFGVLAITTLIGALIGRLAKSFAALP
jgi:hypothetical protein